MGVREIVVAFVVMIVLGLIVAKATAHDSVPPVVCVSADGQADASGRGDDACRGG